MKNARSGMKKVLRGMFLLTALIPASLLLPLSSAASVGKGEALISLPEKKPATTSKSSASVQKPAAVKNVEPETMLQGVIYDLKQFKNRIPNNDCSISAEGSYNVAPVLNIVKSFVNGEWKKTTDAKGRVSYIDLRAYYCSSTRLWSSCICVKPLASTQVPSYFGCEQDVKPNFLAIVYSGYVVAPFTGQFRFVGFGDDFMVVRFGQKLVFDYGRFSATLGERLSSTLRATLSETKENKPPTKNKIERVMPSSSLIQTEVNPLYSQLRLELFSTTYPDSSRDYGAGLAYGTVIEVKEGNVYPIEILLGDITGNCCFFLFTERVNPPPKQGMATT
ncbi:MAG: hypothetical protein IKQ82_05960, partial [Lentisphaeria bacterium]|nr:hypothetical protein [Lentisphaeria bacterium]